MVYLAAICFLPNPLMYQLDEAAKVVIIQKCIKEMIEADKQDDFERSLELTYEPVIEKMGGRKKAIKLSKEVKEVFKKKGMKLISYQTTEPWKIQSDGVNEFVVIPTYSLCSIPGGKIFLKSFMLGISADYGKTWKFLNVNTENPIWKELDIKLPADMKLPAYEPPVILKR